AITLSVHLVSPVPLDLTSFPTRRSSDLSGTAAYVGGSGTSALTFSYTVATGQNTSDLIVSSLNLNGATIKDAASNNADLSGATKDRKTTRLNSSHVATSDAVFCLKKTVN